MIKYHIRLGHINATPKITAIEVERESDAYIWSSKFNGQRRKKRSGSDNFYNTWEDAFDALRKYQDERCKEYSRQLERSQQILRDINALKNI